MLAPPKTSSNFQLRPKIDNKKFLNFFLKQNHDDLKNKTARNFQHLPTCFFIHGFVTPNHLRSNATGAQFWRLLTTRQAAARDVRFVGRKWRRTKNPLASDWKVLPIDLLLYKRFIYIYILMFCLGGVLIYLKLRFTIYFLDFSDFLCWGGVWSLNFWDSKMTPWLDDSLKKKLFLSVPFLRPGGPGTEVLVVYIFAFWDAPLTTRMQSSPPGKIPSLIFSFFPLRFWFRGFNSRILRDSRKS